MAINITGSTGPTTQKDLIKFNNNFEVNLQNPVVLY